MLALLEKHLPPNALSYCYELWQKEPFSFKIARSRSSCFGNYRYEKTKGHLITINHDLNPYAFAITYVHEVAHLIVFKNAEERWLLGLLKRRKKIQPHGKEWKNAFITLMKPILNEQVFPSDVLVPLQHYMQDPAASSASDSKLMQALQAHNPKKENQVFVKDLAINSFFRLKNRVFQKLEVRRTRALCMDLKNKKNYLVTLTAPVEVVV